MKKFEQKAAQFLTALTDVYRDEENRELEAFPKMEFADDVTEDFTAILVAVQFMFRQITNYDGDIIDFTHVLNKLAVQYVLDAPAVKEDTHAQED